MKVLDISQLVKTFDGTPFPFTNEDGKKEELKLEHVLIKYLREVNRMNIKEHERTILFKLGYRIANEKGKIKLSDGEYDAIKRLCDDGMFAANGQQKATYIFQFEIGEGAKKMVNDAETVKDPK